MKKRSILLVFGVCLVSLSGLAGCATSLQSESEQVTETSLEADCRISYNEISAEAERQQSSGIGATSLEADQAWKATLAQIAPQMTDPITKAIFQKWADGIPTRLSADPDWEKYLSLCGFK